MASKFEKLIEYIINEDEAKAKALFHQIVVEKSRDIYEGLQSDEMGADNLGKEIGDHSDVVDGDEFGMHEEDDEMGDGDNLDADMDDADMDDADMADADMGDGEAGIEDRVMDLEDAIDELKAEFDSLMSDEENEEENFPGIHDADGEEGSEDDSDLDSDEVGTDELGDEADSEGMKFGEASIYGESKTKKVAKKSPSDLMREYVEKVGKDWGKNNPTEGEEVGSAGTKATVNTKSTSITGKNDMGGTTKNIAQGGYASDRDSNTGPKKPSNAYTKGETKMGQDKYENSPGANTKGYKDKKSAKTKEGSTTNGSVAVAKKSVEPGGKPGFKG